MYNLTLDFLYREVKKLNPLIQLSLDKLYFSPPVSVLEPGNLEGNTRIRLTAIPATKREYSKVISYNRVDLSLFMAGSLGTIPAPLECETARELVPYFLKELRVLFSPEDIEDTLIDRSDPDNVTVAITPKPTSISWLPNSGGVFKVTVGPSDVDAVLTVKNLPGIVFYPLVVVDAGVYLGNLVFDKFAHLLSNLTIEVSDLIPIITAVTGDIWSLAPGDFSLSGAVIKERLEDGVLTILLGEDCTNITGELVLKYDASVTTNPGAV